MPNIRIGIRQVETLYRDSSGQITIKPVADVGDNSTGNGILHTGHYMVLLAEGGFLTEGDKEFYTKYITRLYARDWDGSVVPGLLIRSIWKWKDSQAHDDYIGHMAASYFVNKDLAKKVLEYGEKCGWCWDNLHPYSSIADDARLESFHDRFPGQISFYRMCVGQKVSIYEQLPLFFRIFSTAFTSLDSSDSRIHAHCMFAVASDQYSLFKVGYRIWHLIVKKRFGSLGKSWYKYYWDHPFVEFVE